jgi:uncharacterized protein YwgA
MANCLTLSRKELLVMLLYSPDASGSFNRPVPGRTRLVKMMFLFKEEVYKKFKFDKVIEEKHLPRFAAWKFGPFSRDVYEDIDFLRTTGFVDVITSGEAPAFEDVMEQTHIVETGRTEYDRSGDASDAVSEFEEELFALTPKGCRYAESRVWEKLSENQISALAAFKERMVHAPLITILRYVYEKYPDQAAESEIRARVMG